MLTASVAADAVTFVAVNLSTMVRTPVGDVTCVVCELSAYFASSNAFATTVILGTPALALLRVCLVHRIANAIRRRSARGWGGATGATSSISAISSARASTSAATAATADVVLASSAATAASSAD